jgi:glycosyltransferase involved in cell wall biosynthesis
VALLTTSPRVSICVPAFNAERHLAVTLRYVLAQTCADLEIVVLDNASTDRSAEIVHGMANPRVHLVHNDVTLSLPDNWNRAVEVSRGTLVKVVCADDLIHPDLTRRQRAILDSDPGIAIVASRRHLIDDAGRLLASSTGLHRLVGRLDGAAVAARVVRSGGNPIGEPAGVMFRRDDFDAVGGFDASLLFPMDLDMWMKLLARGDFVGMPEPMAAFRASADSLSSRRLRSQYDEQLQLTRQIATDPRWQIRRLDRALSPLGASFARARRELLFRAASHPLRVVLSKVMSGPAAAWLEAAVSSDNGKEYVG